MMTISKTFLGEYSGVFPKTILAKFFYTKIY